MIYAEVHSDDHNVKTEFDATPWFEQAFVKDLIELSKCGWGGDYPADNVAKFCSDFDENVQKVFDYLDVIKDDPSKKDCCGFECHIDRESAIEWLKANRPEIA